MFKKLAESFKQTLSPVKAKMKTRLPGPLSFPVPHTEGAYLGFPAPPDPYEGFKTHKYFDVNIVEDYEQNCQHLPQPPRNADKHQQEAFMTLNLLKDEPAYMADNIFLPAKERFFKQGTRWRFNTYSCGVIDVRDGPEIVDEAIQDLEEAYQRHPLAIEWNHVLEMCCQDKLQEIASSFLDVKRLQSRLLNPEAITEYVREYGEAKDDEEIVTIVIPRASHGFEVVMLALLDFENRDRRFRRMILDPHVREIGMVRVKHPQIDYINMIILKKSKINNE